MTKEKTVTKTMKYRIKFNKELYEIIGDIQYDVWKVKNKAITMAYDWQQFSFGYNERFGCYPKEKEVTGKSLVGDVYNELKHMATDMSSNTFNTAVKESVDKFKEQRVRILRGEESLVTYKRDGSIPIRATQIRNIRKVDSKTYHTDLSLLSTSYVKKWREELKEKNKKLKMEGKEEYIPSIPVKTQIPVTLMTGRGANDILDRIISGEYKLSDSRITQDRKGRCYLAVAYTFVPEKKEKLNPKNIMGVDLGVAVPAYIATNYDGWYKQAVGDAEHIRNFESQMTKRKRSLQSSRKWAGDGSVGHGVKTRIKPLDKLSGKIARFKEHHNHLWSRYIVNEAVKMNCGRIQMEDLTGVSNDSAFLKTWTYYQLQQMIEYKAKEAGIEVVKVDPKYTSSRCNKCGNIHTKDNIKQWRPSQDQFKCMTCDWGHKFFVNADWNASLNISIDGIEDIIEEQLDIQGIEYKKKEKKKSKKK